MKRILVITSCTGDKAVDHESAGDPGAGHGDLEDALGGLGGAGGAESALGVGGGHVLGCR